MIREIENKAKRVVSVEWIRIYASFLIIMFHFEALYYGENILFDKAAIVVEFFFMTSGFLLIKGVLSKKKKDALTDQPENLGETLVASLDYSYKKAKSFYAAYIFNFALVFIISQIIARTTDVGEILKQLFHFKWEALLLQMAGFNPDPQFNIDYLVGPTWYLSAMLIAMIPVYYLATRYPKAFTNVIAPVSAMCIYGYIMQGYGTMDVGNEMVMGFIMLGILRAFAGLCVGVVVYGIYTKISSMKESRGRTAVFSVIDVIGYISLPCIIILHKLLTFPDMLFYVFIFAFLILLAFLDETPISRFLNTHATKLGLYLGKLSLYVYIFHWFITKIFTGYFSGMPYVKGTLIFLAVDIVFSMIMMWLFENLKLLHKGRKDMKDGVK